MKQYFKVLEDFIVEEILKLAVISLLCDAIFGFLPQFIRDIIISEARTVEHDHLEQVFHAELQMDCLHLKVAQSFRVTRVPCNLDGVLVLNLLDSLGLLHLILSKGVAILADQDFVVDGSDSQMNPFNELYGRVGELGHNLE